LKIISAWVFFVNPQNDEKYTARSGCHGKKTGLKTPAVLKPENGGNLTMTRIS
jgi:hypothetical protein